MDIVSHALAGAATGIAFGRPVAGAVFGVMPDLVLGIRRKFSPTPAYDLTHSLSFVFACGGLWWALGGTWVAVFALLSHIVLDLPTHGKQWAPVLLYPLHRKRFSYGVEWEWFSISWWRGLVLTIIWSSLWIFGSQFLTGYL